MRSAITSAIYVSAFCGEETLLKQSSRCCYLFTSSSLIQHAARFLHQVPLIFKGQDYIVINNVSIVHVCCFYILLHPHHSLTLGMRRNVVLNLFLHPLDVFFTINLCRCIQATRSSSPRNKSPHTEKTWGNNACFGSYSQGAFIPWTNVIQVDLNRLFKLACLRNAYTTYSWLSALGTGANHVSQDI